MAAKKNTRKPVGPVATRIVSALKRLDMTRADAADFLGVPKTTFFRAIGETGKVPATWIVPLSMRLGVDPLWLLCEPGASAPKEAG